MNQPLAIDLFCGLGGWAEGFLDAGYRVIGFDIEQHDYGKGGYPAQLVLQNVLTLNGRQFKDAACIVASPPCQFFSYCAMPWSRAKKLAADTRADPLVLDKELSLFNACFRIQREACEAAGRHIPLVVENVCGAQKWVGRAKWHYGSFYLWGDVPVVMPIAHGVKMNVANQINRRNDQAGNTNSMAGVIHDHRGATTACGLLPRVEDTFGWSRTSQLRNNNSHSAARKAASAMIAKIPYALAKWIAEVYKPEEKAA